MARQFYPQPADVGLDRLSTLTAAWLVRRQAVAEAEGRSVLLIAKAALRQMLRNELSSYRWQARSDHARCGVGVTAPFLILWPARGEEVRSLLAPLYGWFTEGYETAALQAARALGAYDEKKSMRSEFASV